MTRCTNTPRLSRPRESLIGAAILPQGWLSFSSRASGKTARRDTRKEIGWEKRRLADASIRGQAARKESREIRLTSRILRSIKLLFASPGSPFARAFGSSGYEYRISTARPSKATGQFVRHISSPVRPLSFFFSRNAIYRAGDSSRTRHYVGGGGGRAKRWLGVTYARPPLFYSLYEVSSSAKRLVPAGILTAARVTRASFALYAAYRFSLSKQPRFSPNNYLSRRVGLIRLLKISPFGSALNDRSNVVYNRCTRKNNCKTFLTSTARLLIFIFVIICINLYQWRLKSLGLNMNLANKHRGRGRSSERERVFFAPVINSRGIINRREGGF